MVSFEFRKVHSGDVFMEIIGSWLSFCMIKVHDTEPDSLEAGALVLSLFQLAFLLNLLV